MANLVQNISAYVLLLTTTLFITPFIIYYMVVFWSHRYETVIHTRHPLVVILFSIFLLINMLGDKGLFMISILLTPDLTQTFQHPLYIASDWAYYFSGPCIFSLFALRSWLCYYDLHWIKLTHHQNKWAHWINDTAKTRSMIALKTNFYINHKHNYGHSKWLLLKIFLPSTCSMAIILYTSYCFIPTYGIHYYILLLYMLFMIVLVIVIYSKLPKQQLEIIKLKKELFISLKIGVSFLIFFTLYISLKTIVFEPDTFWLVMLYQYICVIHYVLGAYMSTIWILKQTNLMHRRMKPSIALQINSNSDTLYSNETHLDDLQQGAGALSLVVILRNKVSFDLFMEHLHTEISMESLLCVVEMWQFKEWMDREYQNTFLKSKHTQILNVTFNGFRLPQTDEMPKSEIVYNERYSIQKKVIMLMKKYIVEYSVLEVNISGETRDQMTDCLVAIPQNEVTLQQLYDVFDEVILELLHLLRDSFNRFTHTEEHAKLAEIDLD
eukprot:23738_1